MKEEREITALEKFRNVQSKAVEELALICPKREMFFISLFIKMIIFPRRVAGTGGSDMLPAVMVI